MDFNNFDDIRGWLKQQGWETSLNISVANAVDQSLEYGYIEHYGYSELCAYIKHIWLNTEHSFDIDDFAWQLDEVLVGIENDGKKIPTLEEMNDEKFVSDILQRVYDLGC